MKKYLALFVGFYAFCYTLALFPILGVVYAVALGLYVITTFVYITVQMVKATLAEPYNDR